MNDSSLGIPSSSNRWLIARIMLVSCILPFVARTLARQQEVVEVVVQSDK